jgi:DNA-binding MarR family transcriptional regulator
MELPQQVTGALLDVLGRLVDAPDGAYGYQIARATGRARGTVSVVLRRLVTAGWATRRWDTSVAPARVVVKLTLTGLELAQKTLVEFGPPPTDTDNR